MNFDLLVLGGGPAGYLAAERAGRAGMKVALVEERSLGGVCLNEGCIPTKTLLYSAKLYDGARLGDKYGIKAEGITIDHAQVVKRKDKVVRSLVGGVKAQMKGRKVQVFEGRGVILGKTAEGFEVEAAGQRVTADKLLIATGSSPAVPPIEGLKEGLQSGFVVTNREILDLAEAPQRLCVIGGGVIGLEFAGYFSSIGAQVQVVEMLDHIAGENDQDLVALLKKEMEKRGVVFHLSSRVTKVAQGAVYYEQDGGQKHIDTDLVLLSIGRRANTRDIGLESIGVMVERGAIPVDQHMRTNQPGVYAAGDVTGFSMLAHTAYREAEVAVNHMLGVPDFMRYEAVPAVLYTNPELASVGETEATARKKGLPFKTVQLPMRYSGRYQAENEGGTGQMKLIVNTKTQQILGAQVLSNYASEFIVLVAAYIESGLKLNDIKKHIFPHPTVSEIIREAVFEYEE